MNLEKLYQETGGDMQRASALYPETAAAYRQACAAIGELDTDA